MRLFLIGLAALAAGCMPRPATGPPPRPDIGLPAVPQTSISGRLTYRQRIALPAGSRVVVTVEDQSRAGAAAVLLGRSEFTTTGEQVPLPFTVGAEAPARPDARVGVRAQIYAPGGRLAWTSDTFTPVLTPGAPTTGVEVRLVQAPGQ